jgi:hypothetical protein
MFVPAGVGCNALYYPLDPSILLCGAALVGSVCEGDCSELGGPNCTGHVNTTCVLNPTSGQGAWDMEMERPLTDAKAMCSGSELLLQARFLFAICLGFVARGHIPQNKIGIAHWGRGGGREPGHNGP